MNKMRLLVSVVLIFLSWSSSASPAYKVDMVTNLKSAKIGDPITLAIRVTGAGIRNVSWDLSDKWLGANDLFKIIGTKTKPAGHGQFNHTIVFTVIKQGDVKIGGIPVLISYKDGLDTIFTGNKHIHFLNNKVPNSLSDIRDIIPPHFWFTKYLPISMISLSAFLLVLLFLRFIAKQIRKKGMSTTVLRDNYLRKIDLLETQVNDKIANADLINDEALKIFQEYLKSSIILSEGNQNMQELNEPGKQAFNEILENTGRIRFSKDKNTALLITALQKIKAFINTYPNLPPKLL